MIGVANFLQEVGHAFFCVFLCRGLRDGSCVSSFGFFVGKCTLFMSGFPTEISCLVGFFVLLGFAEGIPEWSFPIDCVDGMCVAL